MARSAVRKKADPTAVRESEKQRAKRNRDKFRQLITDLNECVSKDSLSTNKCLLTAISILSLEKVHRSRSSSTDGEKSSPSSSTLSPSSSTLSPSSSPSSSSSSSPVTASPGSVVSLPITSYQGLEFSHLLTARECFGVGFTDSGIILYTSPNFQNSVGYKESVLGEHLDKIVLRAEDILTKVFKDGIMHFMCMVYVVKMCGKDLAPYRFQGKILPCVGGGKMYLGYGEKKSTIIDDPLQLFNISEVVINTDLTYASKRHLYIDTLLGYQSYSNCTTEHVVSEDLVDVCALHKVTMKHLQKNFFEDGYAQHVCRLQCHDQTLLYVLAKVFLHVNQEGKTVMISYSYPFAFSTQSQLSIDEGMRFITSNEQWLALMPPMCTISQRSAMHQQQLQIQQTQQEQEQEKQLQRQQQDSPPPLESGFSSPEYEPGTPLMAFNQQPSFPSPHLNTKDSMNFLTSPVESYISSSPNECYISSSPNQRKISSSPVEMSTSSSPVEMSALNSPVEMNALNSPVEMSALNSPVEMNALNSPIERKRTLSMFEESKNIIRSPTLTNFLDLL